MAVERAVHARTKYAVTRMLEAAIAREDLPCEAFVDGMAVRVDDDTVFEPDCFVRCGPRLPDDAIVVVDPMIVVEVASPSTRRTDALTKLTRYFRNASIMHYLIVLPDGGSVLHHRRGDGDRIETTVHTAGSLRLDPPGLELNLGDLFPQSGDPARWLICPGLAPKPGPNHGVGESSPEHVMSEIGRVTLDSGHCGGRPCLRGLRIRVKDVLDLLAAGASRDEILAD